MRITPGSSVNSTSNRSRSTWACSPGWVSNRTSKGMAGPGLMSRNLDDLNIQLRQWLDTVANRRLHATTQRVVNEAFAEECRTEAFATCPLSYGVEARTTPVHEGIVSVSGNLYGVPDTTRRRMLDVHVFADKIRIFEDGVFIATYAPLEGRDQRRLDPTHRRLARATWSPVRGMTRSLSAVRLCLGTLRCCRTAARRPGRRAMNAHLDIVLHWSIASSRPWSV
jgi:hypothetical protein